MSSLSSPRTIFLTRALAGFGHPAPKIGVTLGLSTATVRRIIEEYGPVRVLPCEGYNGADPRAASKSELHYWLGYLHNLPRGSFFSTAEKTALLAESWMAEEVGQKFQHFLDHQLLVGRGERLIGVNPTVGGVVYSTENENVFLAVEQAKHYPSLHSRKGTFSPAEPYRSSRHYWRGAVDAGGTITGFLSPKIKLWTDNGIPYLKAFLDFCSIEFERARAGRKKVPIKSVVRIREVDRPEDGLEYHQYQQRPGRAAVTLVEGIAARFLYVKLYRGVEQDEVSVGRNRVVWELAGEGLRKEFP